MTKRQKREDTGRVSFEDEQLKASIVLEYNINVFCLGDTEILA